MRISLKAKGAMSRRASAGFNRRDLVFVILGLGVLIFVLVLAVNGQEMRRTWSCKQRMKELSSAFEQYARDNGNALPPGALLDEDRWTAWDSLIAPYLVAPPKNAADTNAMKVVQEKVARYFHCPSDQEPRGEVLPRSYSMPMYDVKKHGWPAEPDSVGGLGLYLDEQSIKAARKAASTRPPVLKISLAPAPGDTALVVERIAIRNGLWSPADACTIASREQWDAKTLERSKFHGGKFNYLMLDGHVELLTERQSGGHVGNGGVWTIRPGD